MGEFCTFVTSAVTHDEAKRIARRIRAADMWDNVRLCGDGHASYVSGSAKSHTDGVSESDCLIVEVNRLRRLPLGVSPLVIVMIVDGDVTTFRGGE